MTLEVASVLLKELLTPQIAGIALALYVIAEVIKRSERLDDRLIPIILLVVTVGFGPAVLGGYSPTAVIQSIWALGVEMIGYQISDKTISLVRGEKKDDQSK